MPVLQSRTNLCTLLVMTELASPGAIPTFGLGDRLSKALEYGGVSVAQMANVLDVSPNTVGNYTAERTKVSRATILTWAMATGVDSRWLATGEVPNNTPTGFELLKRPTNRPTLGDITPRGRGGSDTRGVGGDSEETSGYLGAA